MQMRISLGGIWNSWAFPVEGHARGTTLAAEVLFYSQDVLLAK